MPLKKKPCAYCGTTDIPRETGHVIPVCMYPDDIDPRVQFRTVPECTECKKNWQDAENQFRNITVLTSEEKPAVEQFHGPIKRSFDKESGPRWFKDIMTRLVPIQTEAGPQFVVYPAEDPQVMLVVRKIVRGLCHYHNIGTAIMDGRVRADVHRVTIPPDAYSRFVEIDLGGFCQYAYRDMRAEENEIHSVWLIRFYGRCTYKGIVSSSEVGFSIPSSEKA